MAPTIDSPILRFVQRGAVGGDAKAGAAKSSKPVTRCTGNGSPQRGQRHLAPVRQDMLRSNVALQKGQEIEAMGKSFRWGVPLAVAFRRENRDSISFII